MRKPSILQTEKKCFVSGSEQGLECHHIYFSANRNISDENGFWIWLNAENHRGNYSPHQDRAMDLFYKKLCQREYEKNHSREDFMELIKKSYL